MTAAATGNAVTGRNRGWRKSVRFALTENPLTHRMSDQPVVPEFFRLVSESVAADETVVLPHAEHQLEKSDKEYSHVKPVKRPTRKSSVS